MAEFGLGIASLFRLPIGRVTGLLPHRGGPIYITHAAVGFPLGLLAMAFWLYVNQTPGLYRLMARLGVAGVAAAVTGGILAVVHPVRILGMILMLGGSLLAIFSYTIPALERLPTDAGREAGAGLGSAGRDPG